MDPVDVGLALPLEVACHQFIGQEHQLLDELVGDVVLHFLELDWPAVLIEPDLHFWHLQVERPGGKAFFPEHRGAVPCRVHATPCLVLGRSLQQREGLSVGQPGGAADDGPSEADMSDRTVAVDVCEDAECQTILVRTQAAEPVAQVLWEHRDDAVCKVNAVAPVTRFGVERGARHHVV